MIQDPAEKSVAAAHAGLAAPITSTAAIPKHTRVFMNKLRS